MVLLINSNLCKNFQDHNNATKRVENFVQKCLIQTQFYQYSPVTVDFIPIATIGEITGEPEALELTNTTLLDINMEFSTDIRTVHDEVYILDDIGLLGSLGGSLGLFIGFSFYGYIENIIDILANIIFKTN